LTPTPQSFLSLTAKPARISPGGLLFFLCLFLLNACSGLPLQSEAILAQRPTAFSKPVELTQVPFFAQEKYQCGPAALAAMMQQQGVNISPDELVDKVYIPARQGSLQIEMIAAARQYGLVPYVLDKNVTSLLEELRAGHPVLVLLNLGLDWIPVWHYAVVVGYDLEQEKIILRSGTTQRQVDAMKVFERTWRRAKYWGVVMLPADQLPVTASAHDYISSVHPLEKQGQLKPANTAYRTAIKQWPNDRNLQMALANNYYALGDKNASLKQFKQITSQWPDYAPALNNIAHLLQEQGNYQQAKQYAQRAVKHGTPRHMQTYRKTLADIESKLR